jgi:hypothetical protein
MIYDNPVEYMGFFLGAVSREIRPGNWQGSFHISKGVTELHVETVKNCEGTPEDAERYAIMIGLTVLVEKILNKIIFCRLSPFEQGALVELEKNNPASIPELYLKKFYGLGLVVQLQSKLQLTGKGRAYLADVRKASNNRQAHATLICS